MMGKKERSFAPLINVSLEELVPPDHFYRHVERTLDLSFVLEFVEKTSVLKNSFAKLISTRRCSVSCPWGNLSQSAREKTNTPK
jgi:hypothetical protein